MDISRLHVNLVSFELLTSSHRRLRQLWRKTRVVIPLKDQDSAGIVKPQLKNLSLTLQKTIQPYLFLGKLAWTSNDARPNHRYLINSV